MNDNVLVSVEIWRRILAALKEMDIYGDRVQTPEDVVRLLEKIAARRRVTITLDKEP